MDNLAGDILIVDDTITNLQVLREMLLEDKYTVRAAINGETALIALQQHLPDLILLDIMMPTMDGYEVCRRVKNNPETAAIPIIFITALSDSFDKIAGFELGAVDYITKPFDVAEVRARVRTHLSLYKQQQENVRLNHLYDDLFNNVNDLIQSVDGSGTFQYVNRCWCETLGYTAQESHQMTLSQIFHPDYLSQGVQVFDDLCRGMIREASLLTAFLSKTGEEILVEGNLTADYLDGEVLHIRGIFRNVTEKKRFEDQAVHLVIEREKLRVLTDFISTTSHDLRTPLTRISISAQMMILTGESESSQQKAAVILEQVTQLDEILTQMFRLTLLESRISLNKNKHNLNTLLRVPDKYQALVATKNIQVEYELAENLPDLVADPVLLEDAFHALLHNALLYSREDGRVTIRTDVQHEHIVLSVADNGVGIAPENQPFIFERFYKVNTARSGDGSGAGLGLALVKKIAEAHDGQILFNTEPGKGSVFILVLPITPVSVF
jgi:PAS domain S-box-containing protein